MEHWSSSYVAVLLLFSVISTLNKSWVVCSLTLGKVMFYTLVENLVRRPTVLLLMTLSESMSSKSFCNGANVSNYLRAFTFRLSLKVSIFSLSALNFISCSCCLLFIVVKILIESCEFGQVLPVPTDLLFSNPKTQQTQLTPIHKVLFKVKFSSLVAFMLR